MKQRIKDMSGNLTDYGEKVYEDRIVKTLEKMGYIKNGYFKVRVNSSDKSIKPGDFVITFEVHKVVERFSDDKWSCVQVLPASNVYRDKNLFGVHQHIKHVGPGQQGITKLLKVNRK